jgi:hypothetical protein
MVSAVAGITGDAVVPTAGVPALAKVSGVAFVHTATGVANVMASLLFLVSLHCWHPCFG